MNESNKCTALAAAIFDDPDGAENRTEFVSMPFGQQFPALWNGTIDISTTGNTHNMQREVYQVCIQFILWFLFACHSCVSVAHLASILAYPLTYPLVIFFMF